MIKNKFLWEFCSKEAMAMAMDPWRAWSSAGASGVAMASCNSPTDPGGGTEMLRQNGIDIMGYIYIYIW